MVHFWFAPTVMVLDTSPVMLGQEVEVCAWAPAAGNSVVRIAASATNRGALHSPPPLKFCGRPKTPASVFLSVRQRLFAMTETDDLHDV